MHAYRIAVLPGDGTGLEVMAPAVVAGVIRILKKLKDVLAAL